MAFPTDDQLLGSVFEPLDAPELYISPCGEAKTYTTMTHAPGIFTLNLLLTSSQLSAWRTHYDNNRRSSDSLTWQEDGASYSCYWDSPPQSQRVGPNLHATVVRLRKAV